MVLVKHTIRYVACNIIARDVMHGNEEPSFEVRCIPKYKYSDQLEPIVSEIKVA